MSNHKTIFFKTYVNKFKLGSTIKIFPILNAHNLKSWAHSFVASNDNEDLPPPSSLKLVSVDPVDNLSESKCWSLSLVFPTDPDDADVISPLA